MNTDRPYQTQLFDKVRAAVAAGHRKILVVLPTGGGKGYMAARLMQMSAGKNRRSIFFASQRELIHQLGAQLHRMNVPRRTIMAGVKDEYESAADYGDSELNTLIAKDTLWSRAVRSKRIELPDADVVHVDECHTSLSRTYQGILEKYPNAVVLGWTATPCRADNRPLGEFYSTMIQAATYSQLQQDGFLVPVRGVVPNRPDLRGLSTSGGDYAKKALQKRMSKTDMVGSVVQEWLKHSDGRQTIVFASGVDHSTALMDEFLNKGGLLSSQVAHLDGSMETERREEIMARLRDGEIRVICNYGVLHTGVDVPELKYLICVRPTKSFQLWRQMGGRIQRPAPGHDHCFIQDHSDNMLTWGLPDEDVEWDLHGGEDQGKKHVKRQKEKKAKDGDEKSGELYRCHKCTTAFRGRVCPICNEVAEWAKENVKMSKEDLVKFEQTSRNKQETPLDKQKYWDKCLGFVIAKNKQMMVARAMYRARYGVNPSSQHLNEVPISSQWTMTAGAYYHNVLKPMREEAKREAKAAAEEVRRREQPELI